MCAKAIKMNKILMFEKDFNIARKISEKEYKSC